MVFVLYKNNIFGGWERPPGNPLENYSGNRTENYPEILDPIKQNSNVASRDALRSSFK
jgi:hypothetical protein